MVRTTFGPLPSGNCKAPRFAPCITGWTCRKACNMAKFDAVEPEFSRFLFRDITVYWGSMMMSTEIVMRTNPSWASVRRSRSPRRLLPANAWRRILYRVKVCGNGRNCYHAVTVAGWHGCTAAPTNKVLPGSKLSALPDGQGEMVARCLQSCASSQAILKHTKWEGKNLQFQDYYADAAMWVYIVSSWWQLGCNNTKRDNQSIGTCRSQNLKSTKLWSKFRKINWNTGTKRRWWMMRETGFFV